MQAARRTDTEWHNDIEEAEEIFLEAPDDLESWLRRMNIMKLSDQVKMQLVIEKSEQLIRDGIIAVPPQVWSITNTDDGEEHEPSDEDKILYRLGFIFIAYRCNLRPPFSSIALCVREPAMLTAYSFNNLHRVDCWWWESMEMLRKFLMT